MPGGIEWIILLVIVLIIFGPKNLPKIGSAIGKGIKEMRKASKDISSAMDDDESDEQNAEKAIKKEKDEEIKEKHNDDKE